MVTHTLCTVWFTMITVTYLPLFVTILFRGMPGIWKSRHRLILCWLVFMQALYPGRKTLEELARWTPAQITVWRFRRLLKASYWNVHVLVEWWGQEALNTLPPPKDGTLFLVGDGSEKPKRGTQNPLAQKGRKSEHHPWFFGIRFALLIVNWDVYRFPVAFRLIRPKSHPAYQAENALFREMVRRFVPPPWAKQVIVEGDAAYGSQDNIKMVMKRDADDSARRWGFVFAIARTWKTVEDKAIKDLVTHLPRKYYQRARVPRLPGAKGCKTFWVYSTRLCLRHIGDVTVILSKRGRNLGPKHTKILVTNLDEWIPRQVISAYQRRWPVEQINRELKTDLGLGAHQVSGEEGRIEKSFGIAVLAYLLLMRACHQEILPGQAWSLAQLQHAFRLRMLTKQGEHNVRTRLAKARKVASSLAVDH
jgi:ribosomal protein L34